MTMTTNQVLRGGLAALAGIFLCTVSFSAPAAQLRILQTNSAGDNINIIDPANHGIAVSPDGSRIYVSVESIEKSLYVVDGKTLQVIKKIPLSGVANLIDLTPDGRTLYGAIAQEWDDRAGFPQVKAQTNGGVDVIDTASLEKIKSIPLKGGIHDLNVTPDGKYVIAGSSRGAKPPSNMMDVIDTKTNEIAWSLLMSPAPSPMAVTKKPDGS